MAQKEDTVNKIFNRIDTLRTGSTAKWGKMNVFQMLTHCEMHIRMTRGEIQCKDVSIPVLKDLARYFILHLRFFNIRNAPTVNEINIVQNQYPVTDNLIALKQALKKAILELMEPNDSTSRVFHHPIFGKMTKSQCCSINLIHLHHHLSQFGA